MENKSVNYKAGNKCSSVNDERNSSEDNNECQKARLGIEHPDKLTSYFKKEWLVLALVTVSGLVYNIGLTAGPYFEGQLAQKLYDIVQGKSTFIEMVLLAIIYVLVILFVQGSRCIKRFYVRRFANDTSRNMRHMLYNHLVHQSRSELNQESVGTLMTKAVADVDACAEGMRKFTTEVFDTGIALISYLAMMLIYDWKLAMIASICTPVAYIIAQKMKTCIYRYNSAYKKAASQLNDATMERVTGAVTYRVTGRELDRNEDYERHLYAYEKTAVMANMWENALPPIYNIISMAGVLFIIYLGGRNVLGIGFCQWDIAAFTAFLVCFTKMAIKSAKAAKLFNAVQKAQVSWKRIKPLMRDYVSDEIDDKISTRSSDKCSISLKVDKLMVKYEEGNALFSNMTFEAKAGDIIGVTGPVACGKSSLGKVFLDEIPYEGAIYIGKRELHEFSDQERNLTISYMGHNPELMSDTIENNIQYGENGSIMPYLEAVCLDKEIADMPDGIKTVVGSLGVRLSGGQQARLALARTLYHGRDIFILDDPFSAVDTQTERNIMNNIKKMIPDAIIIILSHRVTMFSEFDKVIWMEDGRVNVGTHASLIKEEPGYANMCAAQQVGGDLDEQQE